MKRLLVFIVLACMAATTMFSNAKTEDCKQISTPAVAEDFEKTINELEVKVLKEEWILGIRIVYGFVTNKNSYVFIDGKKVNIQIAYSNGTLTIGYPVITGGY